MGRCKVIYSINNQLFIVRKYLFEFQIGYL